MGLNTGIAKRSTRESDVVSDTNRPSIFKEVLREFKKPTVDTRAESAYIVATQFLDLLDDMIEDDEQRRLVENAWLRAVQHRDFSKFKRASHKYVQGNNKK